MSLDENRIRQIIREEILEALDSKVFPIFVDQANAQESAAVNVKHQISEIVGAKEKPSISEIDFLNQRYQPVKSDKIKNLECCFRSDNPVDTWQRCYNILRQNKATIKDHYAPEGFAYRYWLFEPKYTDRFYRVKKS